MLTCGNVADRLGEMAAKIRDGGEGNEFDPDFWIDDLRLLEDLLQGDYGEWE